MSADRLRVGVACAFRPGWPVHPGEVCDWQVALGWAERQTRGHGDGCGNGLGVDVGVAVALWRLLRGVVHDGGFLHDVAAIGAELRLDDVVFCDDGAR